MKYLEVSAFDGITHSNTIVLYERLGWDGILVEPIDEYFQLLKINRPNDICIKSVLTSKKKKLRYLKMGQRLRLFQKISLENLN